MTSPFDLQRFLDAQRPVIASAMDELRAGHKRSHWMWFVFPQIAGLGHSAMAQRYAIASRQEALAYLSHPLLGPRLQACTALALAVPGRSAHAVFGSPDDLKFRSSMTLFSAVQEVDPVYAQALQRFYGGEPDPQTLARL